MAGGGDRDLGGPVPGRLVRRRALVLIVLALPALPLASAVDPYVVLLDWQEGHSAVGTTPLLVTPLAAQLPFNVTDCHRALLLDLLYDPEEFALNAQGVGEVALLYDFLVETWRGEERVSRVRVRSPGYGIGLGVTAEGGGHEIHLALANGADVRWEARVRGRSLPDEPACWPQLRINEVEANPAGIDAGKEWIEIFNADTERHDLSGWLVVATHGTPVSTTIPAGFALGPGDRKLLLLTDGQTLDNENETVELWDGLGRRIDVTPALSDPYNDNRTWQRSPDGSATWAFAPATPPP